MPMSMSGLVALLLLSLLAAPSAAQDADVVYTTTGPIRGVVSTRARRFLGVPYAQPPTGDLRFAPTVPVSKWSDVRDASAFGPGCQQNCSGALPDWACPPTVSEDCLTLSLFAPLTSTGKAPIMIWLHGGNYRFGAGGGGDYDGEYIANTTGVIIVAVNYRLGAFGFLTTDDQDGNYGIEDQRTAMQWVKDNAANFGGDADRITLYGQSAGGSSTGYHLVSPASRSLFSQAIMQSNPWSLTFRLSNESLVQTQVFSQLLGCSMGDMACYRSKSADEIVSAATAAAANTTADRGHYLETFEPWEPVVGGQRELQVQPYMYFQSGNWARVPIMMGTTSQECVLFIYEGFGQAVPSFAYAVIILTLFGKQYAQSILNQFPVPANQTADCRPHVADLATGYVFTCPTRNVSNAVVQQGVPVYLYQFDYVSQQAAKAWGPSFEYCWDKVCHASEIPFTWADATDIGLNFTSAEAVLSQSMISYWTNFAATGNPNGNAHFRHTPKDGDLLNWPAYTAPNGEYMHFNTPNDVRSHLKDVDCSFWDTLGYYH